MGALTHALTTEFAGDPTVRILPHRSFYPYPHHSDPWRRLGRGVTSACKDPGSVSIDLGFSTNKIDSKAFADLPSVAQSNTHRAQLVSTWQAALSQGMSIMTDARSQEGSSSRPIQSSFADFTTGTPWGSRLAGFPKAFQVRSHLDPVQLMVVAHADDESLFGGGLLSDQGSPWLVVIAAFPDEQQDTREAELLEAMRICPGVAEVRILGFRECSRCAPFHPAIYDDLAALLAAVPWQRVVTHGPLGEYGHPQHRELFLSITALAPEPVQVWTFQPKKTSSKAGRVEIDALQQKLLSAYQSQQHVLNLFSSWSCDVVPLSQFSITQARHMCTVGAGSTPYYRWTCAELLEWPGHSGKYFLRWEAHAYPLQHLARELAQTADVAIYGLPTLRRLLYGRADRAAREARAGSSRACFAGTAAALAWVMLSGVLRPVVLPLAASRGRYLQDVTVAVLEGAESDLRPQRADEVASKGQGPVKVSVELLGACMFLFGHVVLVADALARAALAGIRTTWRFAIYGELSHLPEIDAGKLNVAYSSSGDAVPTELATVLGRVAELLAVRGWQVDAISSQCLLESSYQRNWKWSREAVEDEPDLTAREVDCFGCWVEARRRA